MQSRIVVNMLKSGLDVHQLLRSQLHQYASEKECYEARSTRGNGYEFDAESDSESESDESDDDGQHEGSETLGKSETSYLRKHRELFSMLDTMEKSIATLKNELVYVCLRSTLPSHALNTELFIARLSQALFWISNIQSSPNCTRG